MQELLDRGRIRQNLDGFVKAWLDRIKQWRLTGQGHTDKSYAQQFWSDLMRCFGIIPERIDLFERDAARAGTGRTGYIDFFWSRVVLDARAQHLKRSLAQHYAPLGMSRPLVKAHDDLDNEVDKAVGATRRCRTELERQELLFTRFSEMSSESRIGN